MPKVITIIIKSKRARWPLTLQYTYKIYIQNTTHQSQSTFSSGYWLNIPYEAKIINII